MFELDFLRAIPHGYVSAIAGGVGGIFTAWITQRVLNRRGTFSYFVNHERVGVSTEDAIFGSVVVTWNGNPASNLYLSTIELKNESMNDYEKVIVRAYTNDALILSEQTHVIETPNVLEWSEAFKKQLHVEMGKSPTSAQMNIYNSQREYVVPIMNRGQVIKLTYLNSAKSSNTPSIWLSVTQKGVRLKYRTPQKLILGVPQPHAAIVGVLIGLMGMVGLVMFVSEPWVLVACAFSFGLIAQVPGAYTVKILRKLREALGG